MLVDAGLSRRETFDRLKAIGEDPRQIDAILVTHEHSDHVAALPALVKATGAPVYLSKLTAPSICWNDHQPKVELFQAGMSFLIGDIQVDSFTIPHDAVDPVGFCFRAEGCKIGLVTDLGYIPDSVRFHLKGSDLLLLESNHDIEMLKVGPYPWSVKQRVMSRRGHLSNDVVGDFIVDDLDEGTSVLVLGHLSEHNNYPELVKLVALQALGRRSLSTRLEVLQPGKPSEVFRLEAQSRQTNAANLEGAPAPAEPASGAASPEPREAPVAWAATPACFSGSLFDEEV